MYVIVTILKISNVSGHPALYFKMTILRKTTVVHSALMRLDSGWYLRPCIIYTPGFHGKNYTPIV